MCIAVQLRLLAQADADASRPSVRCHDPVRQHEGDTMMKHAGLVVFPASDLAKEKALFTALVGAEPYADTAYYVGYRADGVEIGLDPNATQDGPIVYWETDDIAASLDALTSAGASEREAPRDVGGGMQVATVTDAAGSVIGLRQKP
jgi:predicted enzyme related to lactoylglutathione lyase